MFLDDSFLWRCGWGVACLKAIAKVFLYLSFMDQMFIIDLSLTSFPILKKCGVKYSLSPENPPLNKTTSLGHLVFGAEHLVHGILSLLTQEKHLAKVSTSTLYSPFPHRSSFSKTKKNERSGCLLYWHCHQKGHLPNLPIQVVLRRIANGVERQKVLLGCRTVQLRNQSRREGSVCLQLDTSWP